VFHIDALLAIDPQQKLDWYRDHYPEKFQGARNIFINAVRVVILVISNIDIL
jgi:hypothetical protein